MKREYPATILIQNKKAKTDYEDVGFRGIVSDVNSYGAKIERMFSVSIKGQKIEDTININDEVMIHVFPQDCEVRIKGKVIWIHKENMSSNMGIDFKEVKTKIPTVFETLK